MSEATQAAMPSRMGPLAAAAVVLAGAVAAAGASGSLATAVAAVGLGTLGLLAVAVTVLQRPPHLLLVLFDVLVLAAFVAWRDPNATLWSVPGVWLDVTHLTPVGSATMVLLYAAASVVALVRLHRHLAPREQLAVLLIPVLFNLALSLGADPLTQQVGRLGGLGAGCPTGSRGLSVERWS